MAIAGLPPGRSGGWFHPDFSLGYVRSIWKTGIWKTDRMYRAVTRKIEVTVEPNFLPERSSLEKRQFFWSYTVVITNSGAETVQLKTATG